MHVSKRKCFSLLDRAIIGALFLLVLLLLGVHVVHANPTPVGTRLTVPR